MARHAITRELYNSLVAKGMVEKPSGRAGMARELRGRKCKNKRLAAAIAESLDPLAGLELPLVFTCPWPPSLNAMWATVESKTTGKNIRVLASAAREWRKRFLVEFGIMFGHRGAHLNWPGPLELRLVFHGRYFHANGAMRQVDLSNRIKLLEDALASALHYDDCRHWRVVLEKAVSATERVHLTLLPAPPLPIPAPNADEPVPEHQPKEPRAS